MHSLPPFLACWVLTAVISLHAQSFLPLPMSGLQPHVDTPLPSEAGLVGKMQVWLMIDWSQYDDVTRKHPGRDAYWSARWHFERWQTGDQRLFTMAIGVNGHLPVRDPDHAVASFAKAHDGGGGLVRALAGDGVPAVVVVVGDEGRIRSIRRHTGDFNPLRQELDKLIGTARPLIAGPAEMPPGSVPALQLLKLGDARGALTLAMRKLGPDGRVFATALAGRANERIAVEADMIGNPAQPPGNRFLAFRRLEGLVADFPKAPNSAAAVEAMKRVGKDDFGIQEEMQAWGALGQYLTQAGRRSPTTLAAFQRQMLTALRERFQHTEAARIAGMILAASRIE